MNYYVKGDAAKAEEIKAAFKKLGYDTENLFFTSSQLYYTIEGKVELMCSEAFQNLIKTHPDYKELELPTKHNFKMGDWIVRNDGCSIVPIQIYNIKKDRYLVTNMLGSKGELMINRQDEWHLWTIQDAIDGDVLALNGKPFIYSHNKYGKNYCYIDDCGQFRVNFNLVLEGNCVCPATKQERDLLFSKMREVGYEWDSDKKELHKIIEPKFKVGDKVIYKGKVRTITRIVENYYEFDGWVASCRIEKQDELLSPAPKPHYDIANFHAGMPVLVRDDNSDEWNYLLFSHYRTKFSDHFFAGGSPWCQCIPFDGNEALLGTTDIPNEEYINW